MFRKLRQKFDAIRGGDEGGELKPFLEHLEDLRTMLVRCIGSLIIGFAIVCPFIPKIVGLLKQPMLPLMETHPNLLRSGDAPTSGFNNAMMIALWGGLALASPAIIYFVARFVSPALLPRERSVIRQTAAMGFGLLLFGVWLGWKFGLPAALVALIWFNDWLQVETWWTLTSYISFTVLMLAAFGAVFEVPVVILILGRLGLVSSAWLRKYRRHSIVVALIVAAIATPSPDAVSQLIIAVPLIVLNEVCIWLIYAAEKRRASTALTTTEPPA